jgi:hypothetical protein
MPLVADRTKETSITTGTGTLTLQGAPTGFQTFTAAFGNGVSVYYVIAGGSEYEIGIGTTGAGTLSRDTVLQSTNADALVPFSAGVKDVFCAYVADRAVTTSDAATLTNKTIDSYTNFVGANQLHLKAKATENLAKGDVCKVTGWNAGENAIEVAKVASPSDIAIGATDAVINIGDIGTVVNTGSIEGLNTNAYAVGTILYPNASGGFTDTKPASGQYQACAFVLRQQSVNGVLYVEFTNSQYVEVSTNTSNTVVLRNGSGNFAAGTITAALTGNASTATALQTARAINGVNFDGTAAITVAAAASTLTGSTLAAGVTASSLTSVGALTALTMAGTVSTADNVIARPRFTDYAETYTTPAISAGTLTLNIENGNVFRVSRNANITTVTISNPAATGNACSFTLIFDANGTSYTITWPAAVKWPGGTAPTITTTNSRSDMFVFYTNNAGTTWYAMTAAQNFVTS